MHRPSSPFTVVAVLLMLVLAACGGKSTNEAATPVTTEPAAAEAELGRARQALERLAAECGKGRKGPCPILVSFGV